MFPYLAFEDIQVLHLINYFIKGQYKLYHAIYCLDITNLPIDFILSMGMPVWAFVVVSEWVRIKTYKSSRAFNAFWITSNAILPTSLYLLLFLLYLSFVYLLNNRYNP